MYLFEMHFPSKHARSDKSILVTASYGIYSWCVATDGLDCIYIYIYICQIPFPASDSVPFFQRPGSYYAKTSLDPIWMAWSGFGQAHLVWKPAGVQESPGPVLAQHNWPATRFPLSDLVAFFHRWPRSFCAKPAQS